MLDDSIPSFQAVRAGFDTARAMLTVDSPERWSLFSLEAQTAASMGHFQVAKAALDTLHNVNPNLAFSAVLPIYLWGAARPADYGLQEIERFNEQGPVASSPPFVQYWQTLIAPAESDTMRVRQILDEAEQTADTTFARVLAALRELAYIGLDNPLKEPDHSTTVS